MFLSYIMKVQTASKDQQGCFDSSCKIYAASYKDVREGYFESEYDLLGRVENNIPVYIVKWVQKDKKCIYGFVDEKEARAYLMSLAEMVSVSSGTEKISLKGKYGISRGMRNIYCLFGEIENHVVDFISQGERCQISFWKIQ